MSTTYMKFNDKYIAITPLFPNKPMGFKLCMDDGKEKLVYLLQ